MARQAATTPAPSLEEQIAKSGEFAPEVFKRPIVWDQLVSTGSLLADLAISGGVNKYGGLPGRIIIQVYGPNSCGKTTLMADTLGSVQRAGGAYKVHDGEARLVPSYCETFGVHLNQDEVTRTGTITDVFEAIIGPLETKQSGNTKVTKRNKEKAWEPEDSKINIYAVDSLASLASTMEMVQGDKMSQRRAKDFSAGFRQISDHIWKHNILMFCTDQLRDTGQDMQGNTVQDTTGGNAVGYYSSLRVKLSRGKDLIREIVLPGMDPKKPSKQSYGMEVNLWIRKSSLDRDHRSAKLRLIYGYGWDEIGSNLQFLKDHGYFASRYKRTTGYEVAGKWCAALETAIQLVEDNDLEDEIREAVVEIWQEIEAQVILPRKPKVRY